MIAVLFLAILCLEIDSTAPTLDPSLDVQWNEWRTKHGKAYNVVSNMKIPTDNCRHNFLQHALNKRSTSPLAHCSAEAVEEKSY